MALYQILWVDDDWSDTKATDQQELDKRNSLKSSQEKIKDRLGKIANQIEWKCCHTVDKAVVEIQKPANDFRIAIVDYEYKPYDHEFGEILDHIRRLNIPYIIYSNFLPDVEKHPDFKAEDELRIKVIPKDPAGREILAERVAAFFKAPPFRLLHLSDLHYDSNAKGNKYEYQQKLFDSLLERLKEEHDKNKFDGIAITGDLSNKNPERDLIKVVGFINDLVNKTIESYNIDRLFLVPGNHDLFWEDFKEGKISIKPWEPFLDFCKLVYNSKETILKSYKAWDPEKRSFNYKVSNEGLLWNRRVLDPPINIIGFVTPTLEPDRKGMGDFDEEQENFVREKWKKEPVFGEVRIALMHHNIFASLSLSPYDEKHVLKKSGNALYSLSESKCNIVLNGHTHSPNVYSCSAANFSTAGYENACQLIVSSTGNTSGDHPSADRPRCFNILEFMDADKDTGARNLIVRPFIYESAHRKWVSKKYCQFKIT